MSERDSQDNAEQQMLERFLQKKASAEAARDERGRMYRMYWHYSGKALEIPLAVVAGLLIGVASSLYPILRASRLDPSESVRYV